MKAAGRKIVMLTCYDAAFARLLERAEVDVLLVGDSLNQVVRGQETTLSATLDQMIYHAAAVRRGAPRRAALRRPSLPHLPGLDPEDAIRNAGRVLQETGANGGQAGGRPPHGGDGARAGGAGHSGDGPPGLHPAVGARAGRLQGAGAGRRRPPSGCWRTRGALEEAGAFAIVLELVPAALARRMIAGAHHPDHRDRRGAGVRRAGAGAARHAGAERAASPRSSSGASPSWASAVRDGGPRVRRRGAGGRAIPARSTASNERSPAELDLAA